MTDYRTGTTEKVASTAFLETDYKTNATVSRKTTGVTGAAEVQKINSVTLSQHVYRLRVGLDILTTASLDATPTINELVTAIQAATGYGDAPFGVTAGTGNQLVITWEADGPVADVAVLTRDDVSVGTTYLVRAGAAGVKKRQRIKVNPVGQYTYKLVVDSVTLTYAAGASDVIGDIVAGLRQDADYAAAPFTITAVYPDQIQVDWKTAGVEADSAVLTASGIVSGTTVIDTEGATEETEVQEFTPVIDAQSIYRLTVGSTVLTTAALDATPTIAELNTALQADADYAAADFTTAVSGSKIEVTWKAAGAVADLGEFDYREYIEGPYSSEIPSGVRAVRVVSSAASNLKIGVDAEATASDMLIPANTPTVFKVSKGDRVSFKGTADMFVTHLL